MPKIRVLIYGDSLLLAGVRTLLAQLPNVELMALTRANAGLDFADVVLYDTRAVNVQDVFAVFQHHPAMRLIGLDGTGQNAIVTHGQTRRVIQPSDLTQLITER